MSKAEFTPGPWKYDSCISFDRIAACNPNGYSRCVATPSLQENREEYEANVHLIAAAPDLYEALEGMLAAWCGPKKSVIVEQAKEALAKARGEST